jgi:ATP-dependent helicase/DNAse subunit B
MHNLFCTPIGETVRDQFVHDFADALAAGQGREQLFLLPSAYLLNIVREQIRQMGLTGYEQPNLLSFDELAEDIVRRAGGQRRISRLTQELLVEKVLDELASADRLPYFRSISAFPGYISTVTSLLAEIKRTGTSPEEFASAAEARDWPEKDREIQAVFAAYQQYLKELELADLEELYFLAIEALSSGRITLPYTKIYISEFYILTPLQLELVGQLRRSTAIDICIAFEKNRPELFAAVEPTYGALVGLGFEPTFMTSTRQTSKTMAHIRANLFAVKSDGLAEAPGFETVSAPQRAKEMSVVAAKIKALLLSDYCHPAEIAVAVRDIASYAAFCDVCTEFGVPVSLPEDLQLLDQPITKLVGASLVARADGGSRQAVLNIVKSPLVENGFRLDADKLERISLNSVIRSWSDWLNLGEDGDRTEFGNQLRNIHKAVTRLPLAGTCNSINTALRQYLSSLAIAETLGILYRSGKLSLKQLKTSLLSLKVLDKVLTEMEQSFDMAGQPERKLSLAQYLQYFNKVVLTETIRLEGHNPDGVQVVSPARVRGTTFRTVFVVGLTEGEFPLRDRDSWLYDEKERGILKELGLNLTTTAFRRAEENLFFGAAASLADEQLVLCYQEDAETMPSPYVEEVASLFVPGAVKQTIYTISDLLPADYGAIYSTRELAARTLWDITNEQRNLNVVAQTAKHFVFTNLLDHDFSRRQAAEQERSSQKYGLYEGVIQPSFAAASLQEDKSISITALEDYAKCPFAYFAKRLLGLSEWEEKVEDTGHDIIGTIYHEVLALFLRGHADRPLFAADKDEYSAELVTILDQVCERFAADGKIIIGNWWKYQYRRLKTVLREWLAFEIEQQDSTGLQFLPRYFEWAFGMPLTESSDKASVERPLQIAVDGRQVNIMGKVDRIDVCGDKCIVVDYKRKSCPKFRDLEKGIDLQIALYIMAVDNLLGGEGCQVAGGGYYSVEGLKKEGGMWRQETAESIGHRAAKDVGNLDEQQWLDLQQALGKQVVSYVESIRAGRFIVNPAVDCPSYCVAKEICRYRARRNQKVPGGELDG